ncbi:MAG TPA: DUF1573 domain-containing protein [Opitutaceae bacterium]|jgi:hypothetical protein|nr:DUF1573 domain-containing protein [Opitutaceae bacterium]
MRAFALAAVLIAFAASGARCLASLSWDRLSASETCWAGEDTTVTVYKFRNTGTVPVKVLSADPSCHCTSVDWTDKPVAPGAEGMITATFTIGGRIGKEDKTISVISDDAPEKPTVLSLSINIQKVATIESDSVFWKAGEANTPKEIEVVAADAKQLDSLQAVSDDPSVIVTVRKEEGGKKFIVALKPTSTNKALQARIECKASFGTRTLRIRPIYAIVLSQL